MGVTFGNRVPGTKTSVDLNVSGFTQSEKKVVLIGHAAVDGGTVDAGVPTTILNFGNPTLAKTECDGYFGDDSELGEMVVAAINSILFSDLTDKVFPKIVVIALEEDDDDLETLLGNLLTEPMPHVAIPFNIEDSTNLSALKLHLEAISGPNRGRNGQFGSFGYIGTLGELATISSIAEAAGTQHLSFPWLRDTDETKANKVHEVAAAYAILCAAMVVPYNPINDVRLGKINAPTLKADYHSEGDTGTVALGLASGLVPLITDDSGEVRISRAITSLKSDDSAVDSAYFDLPDWQVLFEYRFNCYLESTKKPFKNKKRSVERMAAFKSAIFQVAKSFETLEMFQFVDKFADQFTVAPEAGNRHSAIVKSPVNVIPGFHQKGIEVEGTNQFDVTTL